MEAINLTLNNSEVKPKPASGVVTLDLDVCRGFAANDPRVHRGCSGCSYDVASDAIDYNWFRYYDPKTGRYITSDRIGLGDGPNTYLYGQANPLKYTDPTGLFANACSGIGCWFVGHGPPPGFVEGFVDFWKDLVAPINPHKSGTCEYERRQLAIGLARAAVKGGGQVAAGYPGTAFDIALDGLSNSDPYYVAGRTAASTTLSTASGIVTRGRAAVGAPVGTAAFGKANFSVLVDFFESKLPNNCICEM